jgi:tetratricopeptide (TPR) repeat protein
VLIRLDPKDAVAYKDRGLSYYNKKDYDRAIADLDQAIVLNASFPRALQVRADSYYDKGDYDRAIADYSAWIKLDPKNAVAYKDRGLSYYNKKDYDRAIADLNQAIALNTSFPRALQVRADSYYDKGDYDRAIADYSAWIKLDLKNAVAYKDRGLSYYNKGDYDRAIADLDQAIALDPNFARAFRIRGDAYYYKADYDRAIADYGTLIRLNPKDTEAFKDRGLSYVKKGDLTRALEEFDAAIRIDSKYARPFFERATIWERRGDTARAIADYSEAIRIDPKYVSALNARGLLNERSGNLGNAVADFQAMLAIDPQHPGSKDRIGRVQQKLASLAVPAVSAPVAAPQSKETRVALVIGNGAYTSAGIGRLPNPKNDAETVAATLKSLGFTDVTLATDVTRDQMREALRTFRARADRADWALVYYAGHGIEFGGVNYLIPTDARLASDRDIAFETMSLEDVLLTVEGAKKLRLVILDACRDNPFLKTMTRTTATRSIARGLAQAEPQSATLVAYAAKHGQVAEDGQGNSPFVKALVKHLATPGTELNFVFRRVRDEVLALTAGRQEPFTYGSLPAEEFYFRR